MRFAAIDIGSNAIRMLITDVIIRKHTPFYKKVELLRVPIRLGEDAFVKKKISKPKIRRLVAAMKAFKSLMDAFEVIDYRACATACMREAKNAKDIIQKISREANITLEVIDGKVEADIIYSNHIEEKLSHKKSYLYIDIGGGSTELTLFRKGKYVASQSFNIGAVRLLHNRVSKEHWDYCKAWIRVETKGVKPLVAIGSGGNINKLYKLAGRKNGQVVTYKILKQVSEHISSYSYRERIEILDLNTDRADVIVPASKIALSVMKLAGIKEMIVPQLGLADGLIRQQYASFVNKSSLRK